MAVAILDSLPPRSAPEGSACAAHRYHRPSPEYCELHHVIPQAWQHFWQPDGKALTEPDHDHPDPRAVMLAPLFDPRTVPLCPTGHRNVHWWIVRLMHVVTESPNEAWEKLPLRGRRKTSEQTIALQALSRWVDAGGTLASLREAKLWGEA